MAPPESAASPRENDEARQQVEREAAAAAAAGGEAEAAAGAASETAAPAAAANGKSPLHDLWKKNEAKAKRVVKLLRRKRQKQQKRQQQQQQQPEDEGAAAGRQKAELLAAVPLRSKQRDLLLPVGRNKKLKKKLELLLQVNPQDAETESEEEDGEEDTDSDEEQQQQQQQQDVEIEFVPAKEAEGAEGLIAQLAEAFSDVFEKFSSQLQPEEQAEAEEEEEEEGEAAREEVMGFESGSEEEEEKKGKRETRKKLRQQQRPSVCCLKQQTARPDRIEVWDTTGADPFFLAFLKGLRNVVQVPQHWSQKRRYLQWKRGFEKPPFKLPPHIEATKISEVRAALVEAEKQKTMRQRMREKVRPKANRLTIDYQVLHDCFFKHAVKPPLTKMGDLYYEGKEFMQTKRNIKPGKLSDRLKEALGMGPLSPPPWLLNMQRYGPPPAYPRLRLPGLNAPIPAGCTYGYQPGGWGRPPVDENGSLLFKLEEDLEEGEAENEDLEASESLWGELPPDAEAPPEEEEPETEGSAEGQQQPTAETPFGGTSSVGLTSMGLESPASLELQQLQQQQRGGVSSVASSGPKAYTVLTPEETQVQQGQLFGVRHTYRIPAGALAGQQQQQQQQLLQQGGASGVQTPAGIATPRLLSGRASPFVAGLRSPFAPAAAAAAAAASGANTPLMAQRGGAATPAGVTVSLNPNEMEQEGAFTADVIRQQLRQHEEAAARAKAAAGQIDPADQRKRKGDELRGVSAAAAKSKRKKQFKF